VSRAYFNPLGPNPEHDQWAVGGQTNPPPQSSSAVSRNKKYAVATFIKERICHSHIKYEIN
jgi:hypothetical protein